MSPPSTPYLLDIDGTLVDSTAVVERVWRRIATEFGAELSAILANCHGRRDVDVVAEFFAPGVRDDVLRWIAGLESEAVAGVVAVPGAAEFLTQLAPGQWAAVTSGSAGLMAARLTAAGLPVPPVLVAAEHVAQGKPHPEGYVRAAKALDVEPRGCVVVEDAPAGVAAGRSAGATVVAVTTTHPAEQLAQADAILPDLRRLTHARPPNR